MKILVTGGAGFIGRYVVRQLLEDHEVTIVDYRGDHSASGADVFLADVRDAVAVQEAVLRHDVVIHLAALLGTAESIKSAKNLVEVNVQGSLNIFQACTTFGKPCVYITVGNYWMNNPYSITKTCAERFAWMYNRELDARISVVRGLNAYGPGQKAAPIRKVIPNFIIPALRGEELTVYGDGSQVMDMIYVEDVADILIRAATVNHSNYIHSPLRGVENPVRFDAGTGRRTTVLGIAQLVIDIVGSGRIKHEPMRAGEPEQSVVLGDPATLRPLYNGSIPGFLSLEEGLKRTTEYYYARLNHDGGS